MGPLCRRMRSGLKTIEHHITHIASAVVLVVVFALAAVLCVFGFCLFPAALSAMENEPQCESQQRWRKTKCSAGLSQEWRCSFHSLWLRLPLIPKGLGPFKRV